MRLGPGQIRKLTPHSTMDIYLKIEEEARGRTSILITPQQMGYSLNKRYSAIHALREHGFQIHWSRTDQAYRVVFPEPQVNIDELVKKLNQLDAAKTYQITRDMITVLRETYQDMPAEDFCAAIRNALISAHSAQIKNRALQRWLDNGIKQARDNNNVAATNKTSQNTKQNKDNQENEEWRKRLQETLRNRPDPKAACKKLYGREMT